VDPALEEFVVGLDPDSQPGFECPQGAGMSGAAVGLRFERGSMLDGGALGMLVLLNNGGWEQLLPDWEPGDPDPLPPEMEAPDGTWLPQDAFAAAWLLPGVQDALGYALEPEPEIAQIVAQQFAGGIVATNLNTGEVVALLGQNRGL